MPYANTLAAYQALLADKPGQALLIGQDMACRFKRAILLAVYLNALGDVESGSEFEVEALLRIDRRDSDHGAGQTPN